ncbi:hypothetical protein E2C01_051492 [Portunus trituberculatus]|uniref:Uncharacterized protein n=1 Tax=Portunus trituberculatus TaxID=210409 RepID=A0A5B7GBR6_PORTR|nr:hypothetical protein [Portunus trituberculatus]
MRPPGVRHDRRYHKGIVTRVTLDQCLWPQLSSTSFQDDVYRVDKEAKKDNDNDKQLLVMVLQGSEKNRKPDAADSDADGPCLRPFE